MMTARFRTVAAALFLAALTSAGAVSAAASAPAPNKALHAFFDREFRLGLEESPEQGTLLGVPGYDGRVTDLSPPAIARRKAHVKAAIAELERFDPGKLSTQDRISRDVMLTSLREHAQENAFYGDLPFAAGGADSWMVASPMFGVQSFYAYLARATPFRNARDYENYLKRLDALPAGIAQLIARMRVGMRTGWMPPREAMVRTPGMLDAFAGSDVTVSPLWRPFASFPPDVPADRGTQLAEAGRRALEQKVNPAFAQFKSFLQDEYLPASRNELGASSLPAGPAYYALRVREQTTTTLTPQEIHDIGKREVARIRGEMDKVIASTQFKGTFPEFLEFIRTDPQFFFKTPEARLAAYRDIGKRADAELPKLFAVLPRVPYGVRAMEAFEGDNADHYSPPPLDGSRAGFFEANVNNLGKRPSHEMESTLLHEAVPGHHLQNARAIELEGLPLFRRSGWYVAYGEGWALYAESLGYEIGMYKDPYSRFGALSAEMLRACRLVIDTGIHAFGWTREQSIRYLAENSGVHPDFAAAEVDRYIVLPGQALGYKIGELKIKALRAKAREALGEKFDLRRFHNALLDDGPLPLTVLEARIDEWIAMQKTSGRKQ
jgi:uncharacterized protein (DUF885 family)